MDEELNKLHSREITEDAFKEISDGDNDNKKKGVYLKYLLTSFFFTSKSSWKPPHLVDTQRFKSVCDEVFDTIFVDKALEIYWKGVKAEQSTVHEM